MEKKVNYLLKIFQDTSFWRTFAWGVAGLAAVCWIVSGIYGSLTTTGLSWPFFIQSSLTYIILSWLLDLRGLAGWKNLVCAAALTSGWIAFEDTTWVFFNDAFVRHIFDNGFRLGWFISVTMRRNLILGSGIFAYVYLYKKKVAKFNWLIIISAIAYVAYWAWDASIGVPDWRQPATLIYATELQAFLLQFVYKTIADVLIISPMVNFKLRNNLNLTKTRSPLKKSVNTNLSYHKISLKK